MQKYHLHLKGYVGGYDFDSAYVDYVLNKNADKPVSVLIDSLGGSLATALSIASAFRNHGDVTVHFVGMNASAATIASLGAKSISMDASAMYLVHKCSTEFVQWASLNADQLSDQIATLEQMKSDLEKMDANVASMYSAKCKKPKAELLDLMKVGGWLSAQEAKEWGFVDELTNEAADYAPVITDTIAADMSAAGIPLPKNAPIQEQPNFIQRLVASITAALQPKQETNPQNNTTMQKILLPFLAAAFGMQDNAFDANDEGAITLSAQQRDRLEAHLQEQDRTIKDLQEQNAQLKAAPAVASQQVMHNGPEQPETHNAVEQYVEAYNNAKAIFDALP